MSKSNLAQPLMKRQKYQDIPQPYLNKMDFFDWLGICTIALIISAPYFHGLYFDKEALIFDMVVGVLGLITTFRLIRCEKEHLNFIDLSLIGLSLCYLVSTPLSVNKGEAIIGAVRFLSYIILYFIASRALNKKTSSFVVWSVALTGAIVTYTGIGSSINFPVIQGGWGDTLSSWLQYHNALGGYLLMAIPLSISLYFNSEKWVLRNVALGLVFLNTLGLFGSLSRGAYIFFIFVILASLFALKRQNWDFGFMIFTTILIAGIDWGFVARAGNAKSWAVLFWPLLGLFVTLLLENLLQSLRHVVIPQRTLKIGIVSGLVIIFLSLGVIFFQHSNTLQPNVSQSTLSIVDRIKKIDLQDQYVQERLVFYKNAVEMVKLRPLVGYGANGWASAYQAFQDYIYYSKETHSQPIRIMVETGLPGLFFYAMFFIGLLLKGLSLWKGRYKNSSYLIGVAISGIFLHSFIDFELSESAVFFTFMLLLATLRGAEPEDEPSGKFDLTKGLVIKPKLIWGFVGVLSFVILVCSTLLSTSLHSANQGATELRDGKGEEALLNYQEALRFNPFHAMSYVGIAQVKFNEGAQTNNSYLIHEALDAINQAQKLDPYNWQIRSIGAKIYYTAGDDFSAYTRAKENLEQVSLNLTVQEEFDYYGVQYATNLLQAERKDEAVKVLGEVIQSPNRIQDRLNQVTDLNKKLWVSEPHLSVTPKVWLYVGEAQVLLGQNQEALGNLDKGMTDKNNSAEALFWKEKIKS